MDQRFFALYFLLANLGSNPSEHFKKMFFKVSNLICYIWKIPQTYHIKKRSRSIYDILQLLFKLFTQIQGSSVIVFAQYQDLLYLMESNMTGPKNYHEAGMAEVQETTACPGDQQI